MPSRFESYRMVDGKTPLAAGYFNPILQELDLRLVGLEELRVSWQEAVAQVQELGLARINELVGAPMEQVNAAIEEMEGRIAALPDMVSQQQLDQQLQAAMQAEATARELLGQALAQLQGTVTQLQNADHFPPMAGKAGQFLTNDGNARAWAVPEVTSLRRGIASPRHLLGIDGNGSIVGLTTLDRLEYEQRGDLRQMRTGIALVRDLGVFLWDSATTATDLDDDATTFLTANGGAWRLIAMAPEWTIELAQAAQENARADLLHASFEMLATSLAAGAELAYNVPMLGLRLGDHVAATAVAAAPGLLVQGRSEDGVAIVQLRNTTSATLTLTPAVWAVLGIRNRRNIP